MSRVTVIWSMVASASLTLASGELWLMRAETVGAKPQA